MGRERQRQHKEYIKALEERETKRESLRRKLERIRQNKEKEAE